MVDREELSRTFYGEAPPPPPWATDCPIRFEVWLRFGRQIEKTRMVDQKEAAAALRTTQKALKERIPRDFPRATKVGDRWEIPVRDLVAEGPPRPLALPPPDLAAHPRVDVILAVSDEFGPERLLEMFRGHASVPAISQSDANPIAAGSYVAAALTFAELVRSVIPLTNLGRLIRSAQELGPDQLRRALAGEPFNLPATVEPSLSISPIQSAMEGKQQELRHSERAVHLAWLLRVLVAVVGDDEPSREAIASLISSTVATRSIAEQGDVTTTETIDRRRRHPVQSVNLNRTAGPAVSRSRVTIKADAAEQLFAVDTGTLTWAVVDSGIDADHPAFSLRDPSGATVVQAGGTLPVSRVLRTFDLVGARQMLSAEAAPNGLIDWSLATPYVECQMPQSIPTLPPDPRNRAWVPPLNTHGTHVAGILAADWRDNELRGICPNLRLFDVRVLDHEGRGDEFSIVAALQLIRHLNEQAGRLIVVGVNLSLSVPHDVANHSTGWTPVCVEADRLMRAGVVVVAAAGNSGFEGGTMTTGFGFNTVSITDPGNTDSIITVGSTHRSDPHRHGVSYFSSRGPTADGRLKPDILAPGEDIDGPVPNMGLQAMHGTSQSAAHVSGAAAMLMARYRELIGRPERIKRILCETATDLGRERAFQGHGLVDTLRAMQSI
jgi:hypothetical protein